jgi:hypothetical protein
MTKTGLPYLKAKTGSSGPNDFNDLENRKSRGIPLRDTAFRKRVENGSIISIATAWIAAGHSET